MFREVHSGKSQPSGFINHHRALCRKSRTKEPLPKAHPSVHNLCFASLYSSRHNCAIFWCFFNIPTAHLKLKVQKFNSRNHVFVVAMLQFFSELALVRQQGKKGKLYLHQHTKYFQSLLKFSKAYILNVSLWLSERASIREIFYYFITLQKDYQSNWYTLLDRLLLQLLFTQLSSCCDPNMGPWRWQTCGSFHHHSTCHPAFYLDNVSQGLQSLTRIAYWEYRWNMNISFDRKPCDPAPLPSCDCCQKLDIDEGEEEKRAAEQRWSGHTGSENPPGFEIVERLVEEKGLVSRAQYMC